MQCFWCPLLPLAPVALFWPGLRQYLRLSFSRFTYFLLSSLLLHQQPLYISNTKGNSTPQARLFLLSLMCLESSLDSSFDFPSFFCFLVFVCLFSKLIFICCCFAASAASCTFVVAERSRERWDSADTNTARQWQACGLLSSALCDSFSCPLLFYSLPGAASHGWPWALVATRSSSA